MIGKIQAIVGKVRESSLQLLSVASEIAATARHQEQTVNNLSSSTTQVAAIGPRDLRDQQGPVRHDERGEPVGRPRRRPGDHAAATTRPRWRPR